MFKVVAMQGYNAIRLIKKVHRETDWDEKPVDRFVKFIDTADKRNVKHACFRWSICNGDHKIIMRYKNEYNL